MMRLLLFALLGVLLSGSGRAQERVRNVRVRVLDSARLEIWYDLITARPGDSVYLDVRSRVRGLLAIRPEFVRGDIGTRLTAGTDRRIVWNALANGYALNEEIQVIVRVKTGSFPTEPPATAATAPSPVPEIVSRPRSPVDTVAQQPTRKPANPADATRPQPASEPAAAESTETGSVRRRYDGPAWALLSVVAPGVGNIFVQRPKPRVGFRPLATAVTYSLLAYGLQERRQARDAYAQYELQKNEAAGEPFYQTANQHHQRYYLATRVAAAVVLTDVVLTFMKGLRNNRLGRETRPIDGVSVRPGLQMGQPTAVMRYSF